MDIASEVTEDIPEKKIWRAGTLTYTSGGLVLLCFWLLWGDFVWAMKDRAVGPSATLLIKQIGVSDFMCGLITIGFTNFTNIFLSPAISYISDRHRGRWGRRIPFLLFTTPFIVLGIYGLGLTNVMGTMIHQAVPVMSLHTARLVAFGFAWVLLDFGTTISMSLFNALANDVVPQELLGRFFALFRIVSLGAGMIFNFCLIDKVNDHLLPIFLALGTLYGVGLLMLCFNVKEGKYPPIAQDEAATTGTNGRQSLFSRIYRAVWTYLRQSFLLPHYCWLMASGATATLAFLPINAFSIQYAQKLGINMGQYGIYLGITYCFSLVLSYFLGILSDRFHPLRTGILTMIAYMLLMLVGWIMMADPKYFGPIFVLHGIVAGCYFTFVASLGARLLPQSLYAQISSAGGLVGSAVTMLAGPIVGKIIDISDYRYVFLLGGFFSAITIYLLIKVYRNFLRYGGDNAYHAPIPE